MSTDRKTNADAAKEWRRRKREGRIWCAPIADALMFALLDQGLGAGRDLTDERQLEEALDEFLAIYRRKALCVTNDAEELERRRKILVSSLHGIRLPQV